MTRRPLSVLALALVLVVVACRREPPPPPAPVGPTAAELAAARLAEIQAKGAVASGVAEIRRALMESEQYQACVDLLSELLERQDRQSVDSPNSVINTLS